LTICSTQTLNVACRVDIAGRASARATWSYTVGGQEESGRERRKKKKSKRAYTRLTLLNKQCLHDGYTCRLRYRPRCRQTPFAIRCALLLFALVNVIVSVNATLTTSDRFYPVRWYDRTGATLAAKSATMRSQWRGNVRSETVFRERIGIGSENLVDLFSATTIFLSRCL